MSYLFCASNFVMIGYCEIVQLEIIVEYKDLFFWQNSLTFVTLKTRVWSKKTYIFNLHYSTFIAKAVVIKGSHMWYSFAV